MDTQKNNLLRQGAQLQNGRYTIIRVLGQGGFGITYQATTKEKVTGNLGEMEVEVPVAIKEFFMKDTCLRDIVNNNVSIPSTGSTEQVDKYRQKFIKEAHNLASLNHPNIVHVADVFEENSTVYYVMQFLKDGSLRDQLKAQGRLSEEDAVRYTTQIAQALQYMHSEKHMCHYDVKPGNILLNGDRAMLIDFGISKNYTSDGRETSATPVGLSKGFAPLEQFQQSLQDFSPVTDIYSLGATLYNLVTGEVPPEASTVNEEGLGERPEYVSEQVWNAITSAMQPRRKDRPQSMQQFLDILHAQPAPPQPELPPIPTPDYSEETQVGYMPDDEEIVISRPGVIPPPPPIAEEAPAVTPPPSTLNAQPSTPPPSTSQQNDYDESTTFNEPETPPTPKVPPVTPPNLPNQSSGSASKETSGTQESSLNTPPSTNYQNAYEMPPKKKKSKAPLIILVVVIFAAIGAGIGFLGYSLLTGSSNPITSISGDGNGGAETVTDQPIYGNGNAVAFKYTGEVNEKGQPHGKGVAKYTDSQKDTYTGKFENGLRSDPNATLTFKNGDKYEGSFVDDQFGEGTYTIAEDQSYFKGTYQDYTPYNGVWYEKNGKQYAKVVNGVTK